MYLNSPARIDTRLMCYENDEPFKPVRIEIVGSRWRKDKLMDKQAVYVIQHAGDKSY